MKNVEGEGYAIDHLTGYPTLAFDDCFRGGTPMSEGFRRIPPTRSAFLSGVSTLALAAGPWRADAQSPPIRMGAIAFSDVYHEPFYGKGSGIFAKAGFDVEVLPFANSGKIVEALAAGALDVGVGDMINSVLAINAGVPLALFAGSCVFQSARGIQDAMIVAKGSPIRVSRDVIGKTIGLPSLVGMASVGTQSWLVQNNIPVQSVKFFEIPSAAMPAALASGKLDVAQLGEPNLTRFRNEVRVIGDPDAAVGKEYLFSGWFASKNWLAADKDRARRLVAAIYDTARWANAHHDETFAILARNAKLEGDKLKGMSRAEYATDLTPALAQPPLDAAARFKVFKDHVDANSIITQS